MAGLLAEAFDGVTVIDLCDRQGDFGAFSFTEKDVCLVAVPSYGGRVPDAAAQRLGRMNGGGARAVLVAVYGNRAIDDTLLELKDILTAQGFRPVAAVAAVAEHSTMHQFGAGRPDIQDRQQLAGFAEQIRRTLASGAVPEDLAVPGNRPYREYRRNPMKLNVTDRCIRCGSCASPVCGACLSARRAHGSRISRNWPPISKSCGRHAAGENRTACTGRGGPQAGLKRQP